MVAMRPGGRVVELLPPVPECARSAGGAETALRVCMHVPGQILRSFILEENVYVGLSEYSTVVLTLQRFVENTITTTTTATARGT